MAGDTEIKAGQCSEDFGIKSFANRNNEVSTMIVNRNDKGPGNMIAIVKFEGLTPGMRTLQNYRIDGSKCWDEDNLNFYPVEERSIYVGQNYECNIYCPSDSVSLLRII